MNWEEGLEILDAVVFNKKNRHLKDVERIILKGSWQGLSFKSPCFRLVGGFEKKTTKSWIFEVGFPCINPTY
ncbi:hypothetical protein IQ276_008705 [Desmonostoc muscorum LEGE 12446]|uniref:vWA-MoxR associated protein N-terminal HTH domain-containing protein n=1 Tax=Desmonostoc muscorum LEGE 12446 TaxID=1828758 RepID=A0A8J7D925_DESMC|nr:hypothetical protein [Desmonostoc muscorum]MCF2146528.1 hypothetical protein [Desmonostoc muscorum LEGE 12446]